MKNLFLILFIITILTSSIHSESVKNYPNLRVNAEYGSLYVMDHKIQFSENNTYFNYVTKGGQDVLYAVGKYSIDAALNKKSSLVFLYQPLSIESRKTITEDIKIDNQTFTNGTPMRFLYGFPFFRASYLYDLNSDLFEEFSIGLSLQIRNATIEFSDLEGKRLVSKRNIGPVPIIKIRTRHRINDYWWFGSEFDGFYAPISYLNGSDNEVVGAILDANLRIGLALKYNISPYFNWRYLGGGAVGKSVPKEPFSDGYTKNWLHFTIISLGISIPVSP